MILDQRAALPGDKDVLFGWRNDPLVRRFTTKTHDITEAEHADWFFARLKKAKTDPIFLFSDSDKLIGMSRLDFIPESFGKFEISILVDPEKHGRGYGSRILGLTCLSFQKSNPLSIIIAKIHENNLVSQHIFKKEGFQITNKSGDFLTLERTSNQID
jgi:RimJ/RimL family protein N-acetyltransferase